MNAIKLEIIIPALTFFSFIAIGTSILLSRMRKRKMLELRLQDRTWTETGQVVSDKKPGFSQFLGKLGNLVSHGKASTSLWEQLARAGYLSSHAAAVYNGIKILLFTIGLASMAILVMPTEASLPIKMTLISLGGALLFFIPNIVILLKQKQRRDEIRMHLAEAVDLLETCVSSGIGLDMAWNMVADEIQHVSHILASEMALTNFEIHLGASRVEAMRHMAERTGADELSSLVAILIQTDRFGTSIATALRAFASSMRQERNFSAEENAEKMAVKLIVPMVLFIFPSVVIILAGPAFISIFNTMLTQ